VADQPRDDDDRVMVVIMTTILGVFFFAIDSAFAAIVKALLNLAA
jgi:preprotein translocase subunit SecE